MLISLAIASLWDAVPAISTSVHSVFDPSLGALLNYNLNAGFLMIVGFLTLVTVLLQKYTTDQATIKELKEEQKLLQSEMKKYRDHPEKFMEFQKQSMEASFKIMPLIMRPIMYTAVPFILLFRWFGDYFTSITAEIYGTFSTQGVALLPSWIWAYLLTSIFFSIVFRKMFKVH